MLFEVTLPPYPSTFFFSLALPLLRVPPNIPVTLKLRFFHKPIHHERRSQDFPVLTSAIVSFSLVSLEGTEKFNFSISSFRCTFLCTTVCHFDYPLCVTVNLSMSIALSTCLSVSVSPPSVIIPLPPPLSLSLPPPLSLSSHPFTTHNVLFFHLLSLLIRH